MAKEQTKPAPTLYVHFGLYGSFDPSMIAIATGLTPTRTWRRGELLGRTGRVAETDYWGYRIGPVSSSDFTVHLDMLMRDLTPHWQDFKALVAADDMRCVLTLSAWIANSELSFAPVVSVTKDVIRLLADLGAEVVVDFNLLTDDPVPPDWLN